MKVETEKMIDLAYLDVLWEFLEVGPDSVDVVDYPVMPSWMKEVVDNLAFLKAFLMDPPQQFVEDGTLEKLESLASEVGSVISTFGLKNMDQDVARKLCAQLVRPLMPLGFWVYTVASNYEKDPKPSVADIPRTGQLVFVGHLVENLEQLVKGRADLTGPLKHFILQLLRKLQVLNCRLLEIPQLVKKERNLEDLLTSTTYWAYEVEYAINSFLVKDIPIWFCMYRLRDLLKEFEQYEGQLLMEFIDTQSIVSSIISSEQRELNVIPLVSNTEISEKLGEVFDAYPVVLEFCVRTWSLVLSYKERKKEVFHELLDNASCVDDNNGLVKKGHTIQMSEDELEKLVQELLKNKKYFVILEDLQDIDSFNDIRRRILPDDKNGSVVLLTTPSSKLALQCRYGSQNVFYGENVNEAMKKIVEPFTSLIGEKISTSLDLQPSDQFHVAEKYGERETLRKMMDVLSVVDAVLERLDDLSNRYETSFGGPLARRVIRDVEVMKAFVTDAPQLMLKDGSLEEIESLARKVNSHLLSRDIQNMRIHERNDWVNELAKILEPIRNGKFRDKWAESLIRELDLASVDAAIEHLSSSPNDKENIFYSIEPWARSILRELEVLKAFLMDPPPLKLKDGSLEEIESLARKVLSIGYPSDLLDLTLDECWEWFRKVGKTLEPMRKWSFIDEWVNEKERIRPSRKEYPSTDQLGFIEHLVKNYLEQLLKSKAADSLGPLKTYIEKLQHKLRLVTSQLMEMPETCRKYVDIKDLIQSIADMAYEVEYVTDSFLARHTPMWVCLPWLCDILRELEPKVIQVDMELVGDTDSIIANILSKDLKHHIIPFFAYTNIREKFKEVYSSLHIRMRFSVLAWISVSSYNERKKELLLDLVRNASCEFNSVSDRVKEACTSDKSEGELEELVYQLLNDASYFIILENVEDIDVLNDMRRFFPNKGYLSRILLTTHSTEFLLQCRDDPKKSFLNIKLEDHTSTLQTNKPPTDDDVVGFKEETKRMCELLIGGPKQLSIISIVGMPGQGKTTLAKKLYNDLLVIDYFHTRAWCVVSQQYEKRELLLELLSQVVQLSDHQINDKTDEELASMLWISLIGPRFLIILDDIWTIEAWNDLRRCFPEKKNGSRIIITTRLKKLAAQAQPGSILQPLDPLSDYESWELLRKKVFHEEICPPELLTVGIHIAKSCKGLPLTIVLIAGVLAKMERKKDQWKQIAETLNSRVLSAEEEGKGIIELSYKHLPDHLKPCFLYFGAFLEDEEVPVWKLIRLWIAEGFIKHPNSRSLEDVAENYLVDLIGRSLVTIAQKKSNGGVKSCRVHVLLREFCLNKAEEEKFWQLIHGYDVHFSSSNDNLEYGMAATHSYPSTPITYNRRRLCIYSKRNHFILLRPSGPLVRTLFFFAANDMLQSDSYDISFIFYNFKLLKILVLEDIIIGDSFEALGILVHLRYLSVQGYVDSIPPSIANLQNLETLCVKALKAEVVTVPDSIWDMGKLRHLYISESASFDLNPYRLENSFILDNLQTFSTPSLTYGDKMEKMMRKIRSIRKLKCIFLDSWDAARNCNQFPVLSFLNQLESLKVFYNGEGKYPCEFNFPSNLTKLTLSNFCMPWSAISQLAMLCNLKVLKLLGNAFEGEKWEMEDEVFPKLKFLKLDTLNVVQWSAYGDHFPCLKRLLLHKCEQLEEIPPSIGDITTLKMIEVMWCNRSVAISAKKIQEEQLDFGNDGLKIHIHPKEWDLESSIMSACAPWTSN